MLSNTLNILILVGAIQGLITFILLRRFPTNKAANKILSWIILLITLACFNVYFLEAVEFQSTILVILGAILPLVVIMPIGPLVYFYVKTILYPDFRLNKKDRTHFYTVLIDLVPYITYTVLIVGSILGVFDPNQNESWVNFVDRYNMYADIPRWISLVVYLFFTYRLIREYTKKKEAVFIWTRRFIVGFALFSIIWLLHLIPYLIPSLSNMLLGSVGWYPVYMPLIILIYWLGINGAIISFKYYKKASKKADISPELIKKTSAALEEAMTKDRLFLNPTLKLNDLVDRINTPQKVISYVLNQHMGKSFNEYVNTFRVEEFKSRLLQNNDQNLTITGIAFECGFNSQATFQRTFKALTHLSPKEFQQKHVK